MRWRLKSAGLPLFPDESYFGGILESGCFPTGRGAGQGAAEVIGSPRHGVLGSEGPTLGDGLGDRHFGFLSQYAAECLPGEFFSGLKTLRRAEPDLRRADSNAQVVGYIERWDTVHCSLT